MGTLDPHQPRHYNSVSLPPKLEGTLTGTLNIFKTFYYVKFIYSKNPIKSLAEQ